MCGLLEARASVGDQLIRQIFQVPSSRDVDACSLGGESFGRTTAINASCASGRDLGLCARAQIDPHIQRIAIEDSAGEIVNVRQCFARRRAESTNHSPGRLLLLHAKDRGAGFHSFEREMQASRGGHL
jgi:hypothetical protein